MVLADSHEISRVPRYSGTTPTPHATGPFTRLSRSTRVARVDGRRVVRQGRRGGGTGGGVLAVVVPVMRVAARGRGPRGGGRGRARGLHVQGHAHLAVTRQGAPALDVTGDDAEVEFLCLTRWCR